MNITQIYTEYNIMPNIQLHQKRVAGIAFQVCDSLDIEVNTEIIIKTCLLHDLGNFTKNTGYFGPPGEEKYWKRINNELIQKFGKTPDEITVNIIKDMNLVDEMEILNYLSWIGADNLSKKTDFSKIEFIIAPYADTRVAPTGVVSFKDRIAEAKQRSNFINDQSDKLTQLFTLLENNIFTHSSIKPEDITDESVEEYFDKLDKIDF